jgi:hypothetical protein
MPLARVAIAARAVSVVGTFGTLAIESARALFGGRAVGLRRARHALPSRRAVRARAIGAVEVARAKTAQTGRGTRDHFAAVAVSSHRGHRARITAHATSTNSAAAIGIQRARHTARRHAVLQALGAIIDRGTLDARARRAVSGQR